MIDVNLHLSPKPNYEPPKTSEPLNSFPSRITCLNVFSLVSAISYQMYIRPVYVYYINIVNTARTYFSSLFPQK